MLYEKRFKIDCWCSISVSLIKKFVTERTLFIRLIDMLYKQYIIYIYIGRLKLDITHKCCDVVCP